MPPPKASSSDTAVLFGIAGLFLGFVSTRYLHVMFYTTKAYSFLEDWQVVLFLALFAVSFSIIPPAASRTQPTRLIWFLLAWVGTFGLTGVLVSATTASIHHRTLSIPDGLIPVGLWLLPIAAGVSVTLLARYRSARHQRRL